jgi:methylthioribose-1-phosphate isomerase
MTWADGALLAIDQRALPRVLSWLRLTTVDEVIDAIKTLAIPSWTPQCCAEASIKLRPT